VSPASRLLRYSTTVPSTRPRYYSTASLPHHHYVNIYPAHTASLQGAVEIYQRYSTTPLLYYFTTPLLYYFSIPLLYCFTTSLPHHHYVNIYMYPAHTASLALQGAVEIDQRYSTTPLLYYFTTSPPPCIHTLCSHCAHTASLALQGRPALLYYFTTPLLHYNIYMY
jgi:hypothetical protein